MMNFRRNGFTIVELLITVIIIGILATVGTISFIAIQKQSRDSQREASATIITDALEKYYEENGEYPGCEAITASAQIVRDNTLTAIDPSILTTPKATQDTTNSIRCQALSSIPSSQDAFSYTGDSSAACLTGPACARWVFQWRKETGGIGEITSRRTAEAIATTPTLTASGVSISQINTSWTAAQDAVSYELQRSTTSGFSSSVTTSHTTRNASVTGLSPSSTYYFRVRAILPSSTSGWSAVVSASTNAIGIPTLSTSSVSVSSFTTSWTSVPSVTSYQLQRSLSSSFTSPTTTTHTTTSSSVTGLSPNTTYYLRVRAVVGSHQGGWSATRSVTTSNVTAPTGTITISAAMSGANARGTAGGGSCASGTTIERQIRYSINSGSYVSYTSGSPRDVAATEGYQYTFQAQARCVVGSVGSSWVSSSTAQVTRPVTAPTGLTISAAMSGANARGTAGGGSCASGTTIERQIRYQSTNTSTAGSWSSYTTGTPRNVAASQGYRYTFQQQARCVGQNANSGYATSSSANVVRAINAPSAPSVSASTSGSNTTYSRNNVSCPTGTTTRYQYKYLADWNYDSGWYGPTTGAASLTWGTASQGYQYRVQMQAQCYTVHATSGWSGTGTGSYIRPVSPPGAISYRISREGTNNEAHLYATSSCHSSVGLYSRADVHTWDYRWLDVSAYGWYANSHGGTWVLNNWGYYGNSVHTGATNGSRGPYSSGSRWNIATDMMCRNSQTGRASASTGRRESGILYLP